ncbi:MAG: PaaI family thioesterase [Steroidobacteraceae bacterium]|jgi:uncharacterized protein (TIGR00369 family)
MTEKGSAEPRYGIVPPAQAATLSGRELLEGVASGRLPMPMMGRTLTFRLVEVGEGTAVFEGEPGEHLFNPAGIVHGGWALTLIDSAAGCAAHTLLPAGVGYTTVETKVNFSRAIRADTGRVRCEGRVVSKGRQIISAEAVVRGPDGKVLAHGTSTLLVLQNAASG